MSETLKNEDLLSMNLKKAIGLAAMINASTSSETDILPKDLGWATWALEDLLREANDAYQALSDRELKQMASA